MTLPDRDAMIALLGRLGGPDDRDVLDAARALDALRRARNLRWADFLPHGAMDDDQEDDLDREEARSLTDHPDFEPDAEDDGDEADIIQILLARRDLSDDTRRELEEFHAALLAGDLDPADRRYLRALHRRLSDTP